MRTVAFLSLSTFLEVSSLICEMLLILNLDNLVAFTWCWFQSFYIITTVFICPRSFRKSIIKCNFRYFYTCFVWQLCLPTAWQYVICPRLMVLKGEICLQILSKSAKFILLCLWYKSTCNIWKAVRVNLSVAEPWLLLHQFVNNCLTSLPPSLPHFSSLSSKLETELWRKEDRQQPEIDHLSLHPKMLSPEEKGKKHGRERGYHYLSEYEWAS